MKLIMAVLGILTLLTLSSVGAAQITEKKGLTLDGAKKVIAAACRRGEKQERAGRSHCRCRRRRQPGCTRAAR